MTGTTQPNAFQWNSVHLNLPGTKGYRPALAWISKRKNDGFLASDFLCFVNDLRITGQGNQQIWEADHAISSQQSYLGIQDTLRKLRSPDGTQSPGVWAGVNVCVEEDQGVVVLTSQKLGPHEGDMQALQDLLERGHPNLYFKKLCSDWGFLVYVTKAYPGMKPYLKDFHLSLETWRGGQDNKGWKLPKQQEHEECKTKEDSDLNPQDATTSLDDLKINLLTHTLTGRNGHHEVSPKPPLASSRISKLSYTWQRVIP